MDDNPQEVPDDHGESEDVRYLPEFNGAGTCGLEALDALLEAAAVSRFQSRGCGHEACKTRTSDLLTAATHLYGKVPLTVRLFGQLDEILGARKGALSEFNVNSTDGKLDVRIFRVSEGGFYGYTAKIECDPDCSGDCQQILDLALRYFVTKLNSTADAHQITEEHNMSADFLASLVTPPVEGGRLPITEHKAKEVRALFQTAIEAQLHLKMIIALSDRLFITLARFVIDLTLAAAEAVPGEKAQL